MNRKGNPLVYKYARAVCKAHPNAGSLTLAKRLHRENPDLFPTVESARGAVRYIRGVIGAKNRQNAADRSLFRAPRQPGEGPLEPLPEGIKQTGDWKPVPLTFTNALVLSDLHIPFHDHKAIEMAVKHGHTNNCETLIVNGDAMDFMSASDYVKDPNLRDLKNEVETGRTVMRWLLSQFDQAIFKLGNHDEWWESHLRKRAPDLLGIDDFQLERVLRLDGWKVVDQMRPMVFAEQLFFIHGHEYRRAMPMSPVNPARTFFQWGKRNCIGGHFHQTSNHTEKDMGGRTISCWSTGCLCDLHPQYSPLNKWNTGFAMVVTDIPDAPWRVRNHHIVNGVVV